MEDMEGRSSYSYWPVLVAGISLTSSFVGFMGILQFIAY